MQVCLTVYSTFSLTNTPFLPSVFISTVWLLIGGTFLYDPTKPTTPVYLFIPPIPVLHINGMHCIRLLTKGLFYWSLDPEGKHLVAEQDWEKYGIPSLEPEISFGSVWENGNYDTVRKHLLTKKYPLDGKQYARDHGYPELVRGTWIVHNL